MSNKVKIIMAAGAILIALCFMLPLAVSIATSTTVQIILNNQSGSNLIFIGIAEGDNDASEYPNSLVTPLYTGTVLRVPSRGHGCMRNVAIRYADGKSKSFKDVNACERSTIYLAQSTVTDEETHNPSFNLLNTSSIPIKEIYVTPSNKTEWGVNRLVDDQIINQGQTLPIYLPTGNCLYDARIVLKDGQKVERRSIDACRISVIPLP